MTPGSGRCPGEGNATHSSILLAWKIPWTEEPGGLQSTGSQRVGHSQATLNTSKTQCWARQALPFLPITPSLPPRILFSKLLHHNVQIL